MGSGPRFVCDLMEEGFGLGIYFGRFPHAFCMTITLIKVRIYIGFGKGYDE